MSSLKVAQILVEVLQAAGVKHCYGIVGDTLNHFTNAIAHSDIQWVHTRHEEAAAFAAGAESYISGRLTACAGSCGPGSLHFINGVFEAHRNRAPMVLIASQLALPQLGSEFPQEVDFKSVYASCSVYCEQINSPEQARRIIVQACQTALTKRGVAVVIVPTDISQCTPSNDMPFSLHIASPILCPNSNELQKMADHLHQGKKIGIYAGSGCEGAHDLLISLAERLKAPIAHTSRAKDFVEYDNPFNMGMTGMLGIKSGYHMMEECDTLLLLGADFAWTQFYPSKATIIQVDREPTHLGRRHPITLGVVGDIIPTITSLLSLLEQRSDSAFLDECLSHRRASLKTMSKEEHPGHSNLIHPQYLFKLVNQYADNDALFTADGGSAMVWTLRHIQTNGLRRTLSSLVHGTMANAMPQALGLKKAYPQRQVISFSGDGGLSMLLGDLLTIIQEDLPIKIIVLNNGSLNFVEMEQKVEGLLNNFTHLKNPDFGLVAQAMGLHGITVFDAQDLEEKVQQFLAHPGAGLLDVHTNAAELVMPPVVEISQVVSTALYSAKALLTGRAKDVSDLVLSNFLKR